MKTLIMYSLAMVVATVFRTIPIGAQSITNIPAIERPLYATLMGRVTDKEGKGLVGGTVVVEGTTRGAKTKTDGKFTITGLRCGESQIRVTYTGFKKEILKVYLNYEVNIGEVRLQTETMSGTNCVCSYDDETTRAKKSEQPVIKIARCNLFPDTTLENMIMLDTKYFTCCRGRGGVVRIIEDDKNESNSGVVANSSFKLFPNPASTSVTARYDADANGYANIEIYTEGGRSAIAAKYLAVKGLNELPVDVSQLPAGQYFMRISTTNRTEVVPLNIVR